VASTAPASRRDPFVGRAHDLGKIVVPDAILRKDALTTTRAYREALSRETPYEILADGVRKGWWDAEVLRELKGAVEAGPPPAAHLAEPVQPPAD
jgi:HD-GYP domain-containing protein (c-di-GMP phosphodiesterase class II)